MTFKKPRLVGFWDGSSQAFSAVIYSVKMVLKTKEHEEEHHPDGDFNILWAMSWTKTQVLIHLQAC